MSKFIPVFVVLSISLSGCDFIKSKMQKEAPAPEAAPEMIDTNQTTETTADNNPPANNETPSVCPDGSEPKVLTGSCTGTWSVNVVNEQTMCQFGWGPTVNCPEGMKGLSAPAACYGVSGMPADHPNPTADSCMKKFGETPKDPTYTLTCCPE
jgi:hypothetical protein